VSRLGGSKANLGPRRASSNSAASELAAFSELSHRLPCLSPAPALSCASRPGPSVRDVAVPLAYRTCSRPPRFANTCPRRPSRHTGGGPFSMGFSHCPTVRHLTSGCLSSIDPFVTPTPLASLPSQSRQAKAWRRQVVLAHSRGGAHCGKGFLSLFKAHGL